jgi:hypothetical protein
MHSHSRIARTLTNQRFVNFPGQAKPKQTPVGARRRLAGASEVVAGSGRRLEPFGNLESDFSTGLGRQAVDS